MTRLCVSVSHLVYDNKIKYERFELEVHIREAPYERI